MCPGVGTTPIVVPASASRSPGSSTRPRGPATAASAAATCAPNRSPHGSAASAWSPWWWVTSTATQRASRAASTCSTAARWAGSSGPGSTSTAWPLPGVADDVGVGAVEGHPGRIGGEHAGDQRLELDRGRHRAGARQVPCCARVGRDVHVGHGSRASTRPRRRRLASPTMRRTLSLCRSGLAAAAAVVLLTACGGSDEDSNASDSTSSSSSSSSSASETTENTAPQADSEFCTEAAAIQERIAASFTGQTDQSNLGELFPQISEEIRAIEPPAELADDWAQFSPGRRASSRRSRRSTSPTRRP